MKRTRSCGDLEGEIILIWFQNCGCRQDEDKVFDDDGSEPNIPAEGWIGRIVEVFSREGELRI